MLILFGFTTVRIFIYVTDHSSKIKITSKMKTKGGKKDKVFWLINYKI